MALKDVLLNLNNLKSSGIIKDYAICGGYACTFYEVSMTTYDLDVLTILPSETDYHRLYEHFRAKGARIENVYIYIEDMPVQFLPNYIAHYIMKQLNSPMRLNLRVLVVNLLAENI